MKAFLKETAEKILSKYKNDLLSYCIVFPNKRTKLFFRSYYAETVGETAWAPDMKEIRLILRSLTGLSEPDKLSLIFDLYEIFKETDKDNSLVSDYNFDNFYRLGEIIISDFNEIDSWLVNPEQLFRNIKDTHEIDARYDWLTDEQKDLLKKFWLNFSPERQSEEKKKFIRLWNILYPVYLKFKKSLLSKNLAYNGLTFRCISDKIDNNNLKLGKYKKYLFVGFNALNKAEEKLFKHLQKNNRAEFYWDTDAYYHFSEKQEAGFFLRKNFKSLNISEDDVSDNFSKKNKTIDVIGVPLEVGQAKLIPTIIENYDIPEPDKETAVILSDENLLFPVLHSLPQNINKINVTMGYPLNATSLYNLVTLCLKLHVTLFKNKSKLYYYKDVISLLKHPYINEFDAETTENTIKEIEEKNLVYVKAQYLIEKENKLYSLLFTLLPEENSNEVMLTNLLNILFIIFDKRKGKDDNPVNSLENEYIYKAYVSIKRFREIISSRNIKIGIKLTADLLKQILDAEQIPFSGEAVEGFQLMGILESRNLDFKNLIILGLNEGNFPSVNSSPSFISQSMRFAFDMPVLEYQDAVYAYLFYRLLQRSEKITLVYNNIVNDGNSGEMSRFILQLLYESEHKINHKQFKQDLSPIGKFDITIEKNDKIINKLNKYIAKGNFCEKRLSASALNSYIDCPLQFYFRYIAGLYINDTVEEEVSPASFGTILHAALEDLYTDFIKKKNSSIIEKEDFKYLNKESKKYIEHAFKKYYKNREVDFIFEGNQIIIREVLFNYASSVLKEDKKYSPFEIISLEDKYSFNTEIAVTINKENQKIGIKGIIDRVDKKDDIYRVIDYKTGATDKAFEKISEIFDCNKVKRKKHILQTLLYSLLFKEKNLPAQLKIMPCIFDVRNMNKTNFSPNLFLKEGRNKKNVDNNIFSKILDEYKIELRDVLENLYNKEINFHQTDNEKTCEWCDYSTICIS